MIKRLKLTKETIFVALILILSAILNFANISIEGYGNGYYAAGVKSMTMSIKNFFFVSFDPAGFVTIDKPPMGFWIQSIFAKIFGFHGWSILLPQALAGVISVYLVYYLVKRNFGSVAGIISGLCLAITPVFVAASRNNTIDNLLVMTLLFASLGLTIAAEKGKAKYLYISLLLVGVGFNIKMLEAYMIGPAIYITYLLASNIKLKKKLFQLIIGSIILISVSLSWAVIVDLVPSSERPFVGSSTNNSVLELIIGHNGLERLGLSGKSSRGGANNKNNDGNRKNDSNNETKSSKEKYQIKDTNNIVQDENNDKVSQNGFAEQSNEPKDGANNDGQGFRGGQGGPGGQGNQDGGPGGQGGPAQGGGPGGQNGLQGSFGGETKVGLTRLFSKNSLSDQIGWFLPMALLGFIAAAIKEKLTLRLDNEKKMSLMFWILWLVPEFIYFSYTTGLFHPYYLTMMAAPAAALTGIGISAMWELYKEGKWKSWILPLSLIIEGAIEMLLFSYHSSNMTNTMRIIIMSALFICFVASAMLIILNIVSSIKRKTGDHIFIEAKKIFVAIAFFGILVTPFIGSSAAITHKVNETIPAAGLELLSNSEGSSSGFSRGKESNNENSKLVEFLKNNTTTEKYILAVSSSQSADNIIIQTGEPVMAMGGFSGSDNILTLDKFKEMVKNGEVRYVLTGGMGRQGDNEIMNWVTENGTLVDESQYKDTASTKQSQNDENNDFKGPGENNSGQLYDLKDVAKTLE